jgi:hypothetical protein
MKTRTLIRTSVGLFASGVFAAAVSAGPSPQYWHQMERIRAENAAKQKTDAPSKVVKCEGCNTNPIWTANDRTPAGKGAPGARVVGYTHSCARCTGAVVTEKGKAKDGMTRAAACEAMQCCK